jgi:hypothetical protein
MAFALFEMSSGVMVSAPLDTSQVFAGLLPALKALVALNTFYRPNLPPAFVVSVFGAYSHPRKMIRVFRW